MPNVTIYHNPKCTKSRQTLQLLRDEGIEPTVIEYLKQPFTQKQLRELLQLLKLSASDLVRKKEAEYKTLHLAGASEADLIRAMIEYPILIERPIVVCGKKACLGRPPENVLEIL